MASTAVALSASADTTSISTSGLHLDHVLDAFDAVHLRHGEVAIMTVGLQLLEHVDGIESVAAVPTTSSCALLVSRSIWRRMMFESSTIMSR